MNQQAIIQPKQQPSYHYQRLAYILITIMLMMPVLLWPAPIFIYDNPMLADVLTPTWLLSTAFLLLSAVIIDTMLYGISSLKQAIDATIWISLFAMLSISAIQTQGGSWLLAMLFVIHSLRSAFYLFQVKKKQATAWWLWLAWFRDVGTAMVIFLWSYSITWN